MWKKIGVLCVSLLATFSVVYALNSEMSAVETTYRAGGSVSGRINKAPSNLNSLSTVNIGMQKGDKVLMKDNVGWSLFNQQTYTDYGCVPENGIVSTCSAPAITSWLAGTTKSLGNISYGITIYNYMYAAGGGSTAVLGNYASSTGIMPFMADFNSQLSNSQENMKIIAYRNLSREHQQAQLGGNGANGVARYAMLGGVFSAPGELGKNAFTPLALNAYQWTEGELLMKDRSFYESYWTELMYYDGNIGHAVYVIEATGGEFYVNATIDTNKRAVRPFIYLNMNDVVFATSLGTAQGMATVEDSSVPSDYADLYTATINKQEMKLRLEDPSLSASTELTSIMDGNSDEATSITKATKK